MAVRWKAGQRRKRWTEQAVVLPRSALVQLKEADGLACSPTDAGFHHFFQQLELFGQLSSTFAQIAATKPLSDALLLVLKSGQDLAKAALYSYVELLFLENSRPLHRGLLSPLSRLSEDMESIVAEALIFSCLEYGQGGVKHRRFSIVGVVASMSNLPQPGIFKRVIENCLNIFTMSACHDVLWVLEYSNQGGRPPPNTMEDCQDAMGSLYYILQHYQHRFTVPELGLRNLIVAPPSNSGEMPIDKKITNLNRLNHVSGQHCQRWVTMSGAVVYGVVVRTLVDVLQTSALSRDCVVAAGVGLSAAVQFQNTSDEVALLLAKSFFASAATEHVAILLMKDGLSHGPDMFGMLDAAIVDQFQSTLAAEVGKFTEFGRLCVLRGLLTALPRPTLNIPLLNEGRVTNNASDILKKDLKVWTLLYDGVLPALCALCEGSVDSHFKFHTVTALQICLQQVRASVTGRLTQDALQQLAEAANDHQFTIKSYDPLPTSMISRVLQIVWNNWEDPLTQTVKQVQAVFDLLVDIQYVFSQQKDNENKGNVENTNGEFVEQIAANLLAEGRYRKGKYVPLASLALRIGSQKLLSMNPNLLFDTFHAQSDDDVCCSASTFLKTFLERLREDCWSSQGGVTEGYVAFRRLWIPPLLTVLLSGNPRLRSNLNTYALPVALHVDPDSVLSILAFILDGAYKQGEQSMLNWDELEGAPGLPVHLTMHQRVAALISVLKVARSLALMEGDVEQKFQADGSAMSVANGDMISSLGETVVVRVQNEAIQVPVSWLEKALTHLDDSLRVDAAELICLNPKTASMPSSLELRMLRISIPLNMRCSSTSFRMRWTSLLKKFFQRVRTAAWRQHRFQSESESESIKIPASVVNYGDEKKKKRAARVSGQRDVNNSSETNGLADSEQVSKLGVTTAEMQDFMQLLCQYLLSSLYPSAPYERKNMAMELLNAIFEVWSLSPGMNPTGMTCPVADDFSPYQAGLLSAEATLVVVGAIVDSWDKLRESAFRILMRYPTPLPGLESTTSIEKILLWAKGLVSSPRVRESDAGALVLRLIFHKYVLDLGWTVNVHTVVVSSVEGKESVGLGPNRVGVAIAEYVESLNDWLEWGIEEGDKDLLKACSHSFVHGVLLALRYTMEELPWTSVAVQEGAQRLRVALHKLISLLLRVTALTLWVVSANALNLPPDMMSDTQAGGLDDILDINVDDESFEDGEGVAPVEQMIMVGCWLSMKEVSLLLGTIAREVPLPGGNEELENTSSSKADEKVTRGLLDAEQLEAMGAHFLQVLLAMKHNGAIDKTRAGFIALCDRLLRSPDPRLNKLPEIWMKQLLERTGAKGQTVDNLLRRSAGIPAAFLALFLAEPDGAPKKLLPMAMSWLIDTSKTFVGVSTRSSSEVTDSEVSHTSNGNDLVCVVGDSEDSRELQTKMKERDEGVVPTVHAFNALRVAFHDTNLATDTSGFCAEGLITAIQAFSCPHWEVRNSATLAFTALVHRMIGFLNVYKRESARRAITGFEFFHRFPTLHPFLLQELRSATLQLQHEEISGGYRGHGMASTLHPSLGPVLIVLSRLKPSVISSGVGDWLSPSAFRPFVTSCATQSNFHVRVLASRALAPLVSAEDLPTVLLELAEILPGSISVRSGGQAYNATHGMLLQMTVLLTSNCSTLPDLDIRQTIVKKLCTVVEQHLWLGSIRTCPCSMVVGAFISMLEGMLELAQSCGQAAGHEESLINNLQALLLRLCSECLEDVFKEATSWHESMQVNLQERVVKLYFATALTAWPFQSRAEPTMWNSQQKAFSNTSGSVLSETNANVDDVLFKDLGYMFTHAIAHRMYEVRLASLKVLKQFSLCFMSSTKEVTGWVGSYLQPLLVERLSLETHPGCIRRILHVFFAWRSLPYRQTFEGAEVGRRVDRFSGWGTSSLVIWDRVLHIYRTSKHTRTKEVAMRCMGACLSHLLDHLRQSIEGGVPIKRCAEELVANVTSLVHVKEAVNDWIQLVNKHSAASESVNFRRATAEAIVASGLLEQVSWVSLKLRKILNEDGQDPVMVEWFGRSILQVWCVSVKLLEDEDADLRQILALSLLEILALPSGTVGNVHISAAVPSQVERVVQLVFQSLSAHFGSWRVYWEVLAEWVLGSEDIAALVRDVDLVRRLFDKEIDNHHEEELVFVQLCCLHLRQLVCSDSQFGLSKANNEKNQDTHEPFVGVWRKRFLEQAKSCAELTVCMQEKMPWVGGVTNHQDAFKMVYRRLLGLLTFAGPCTSDEKQVAMDLLSEISGLLRQLPLNPLVSNLMFKVLQAYEKHMDVDLGSTTYRVTMGLAFCDKFEPLFLIE